MSSLRKLQERFAEFKEERDWEKFHQPKNIAMALSVEAGELVELFQWKDNVPVQRIKDDEDLIDGVREELADIILYSLSMAQKLDIDLEEAVSDKLEQNRQRFDEETAAEITEDLEQWRN